jgi:death on curing protein
MTPQFLLLEEVLLFQKDQVDLYGGSVGVRDMGLLESAVAMPQAAFGGQFLHADVFEMSAAYLFHIAQNHPFVDGNKRVALVATAAFLYLNGHELTATNEEAVSLTLSVARGEMPKSAVAEFLRKHSRKRRSK